MRIEGALGQNGVRKAPKQAEVFYYGTKGAVYKDD